MVVELALCGPETVCSGDVSADSHLMLSRRSGGMSAPNTFASTI